MSNRAALPLREGDAEVLRRLTRSSSVRAGLAQRARIVLLASEGMSNTAIAERLGDDQDDGGRLAEPVRRGGDRGPQ